MGIAVITTDVYVYCILLCPSEQLTSGTTAVCSPRLSPDHCRIVYLECAIYGPHMQCSKLCMVRQDEAFQKYLYDLMIYTFVFICFSSVLGYSFL